MAQKAGADKGKDKARGKAKGQATAKEQEKSRGLNTGITKEDDDSMLGNRPVRTLIYVRAHGVKRAILIFSVRR